MNNSKPAQKLALWQLRRNSVVVVVLFGFVFFPEQLHDFEFWVNSKSKNSKVKGLSWQNIRHGQNIKIRLQTKEVPASQAQLDADGSEALTGGGGCGIWQPWYSPNAAVTSMLREINKLVEGYTEKGIWLLSSVQCLTLMKTLFAGALMVYLFILSCRLKLNIYFPINLI